MQVKKEEIKSRIVSSAQKEFLKHGYLKASLRTIADNADLTKGAIYSYFANKDTLFCELSSPAVNFIESEFNKDKNCFDTSVTGAFNGTYELTIQSFKHCAHAVLDSHESFKLLLFCAGGSSLQNYKERIIKLYSKNFNNLLSFFINEKHREGVINEIFIHTLASTYVSFLQELVLHEPDIKGADDYAEQMAVFVHSGIEKLYFHQLQ